MLRMFGGERVAVVVGDLFFVDPHPARGQKGAEAGVRVELRRLNRPPLQGSIYSAQPIGVETPLVRVDLFETFPDGRGSLDRVHYHPRFDRWDPGPRQFHPALSADPLQWLLARLTEDHGFMTDAVPDDRGALTEQAEEIVDTVDRLWAKVRSGVLDPPAGWTAAPSARQGWL